MKLIGKNWRKAKRQRLYYRRRIHDELEPVSGPNAMFVPVQAYPLQVTGWEYLGLFTFYERNKETHTNFGWALYEITTGERLCAGRTMDDAVAELLRRFEHYGRETVDKKIAELLARGPEYHSPLCSASWTIQQAANCARDTVELYLQDVADRRKAEAVDAQTPSKIPYPIHPWESLSLQDAKIAVPSAGAGKLVVFNLYIKIKERAS